MDTRSEIIQRSKREKGEYGFQSGNYTKYSYS